MDQFMPATILFIIFAWGASFFVATSNYDAQIQKANEITYNYTQLAAKKGELTSGMYSELKNSLAKFGEFDIYAWAERHNSNGSKTIVEGSALLNYDLRENDFDIIQIHARSKKDHALTYFYKMAIFGATSFTSSIRVNTQAASYVQ